MESEKSAGTPSGLHEFRDKRWVELYREKIDEMIRVLRPRVAVRGWVCRRCVGPRRPRHGVSGYALSRMRPAGGITYVDVGTDLSMKPGAFTARPDFEARPAAALLRWRVLHQGRRAQARALCRARTQPAVGRAFRPPIVLPPNRATPTPKRGRSAGARPLAGPIVP